MFAVSFTKGQNMPKLQGKDDYEKWLVFVTDLFVAQGWPEDFDKVGEDADSKRTRAAMCCALRVLLSPNIAGEVVKMRNPLDIMNHLRKRYGVRNIADHQVAMSEYYDLKLNVNETADKYWQRSCDLRRAVESKQEVSSYAFLIQVINGVGRSPYGNSAMTLNEHFRLLIETKQAEAEQKGKAQTRQQAEEDDDDEEEVDEESETFQEKLKKNVSKLTEEFCDELVLNYITQLRRAMTTWQSAVPRPEANQTEVPGRRQRSIQCFRCFKKGHHKKQCRTPKSKLRCTVANCPKPKGHHHTNNHKWLEEHNQLNGGNGNNDGANNASSESQSPNNEVLMLFAGSAQRESNKEDFLLLDSGANCHIVHNASMLTNFKQFNEGDRELVHGVVNGNGAFIEGIGDLVVTHALGTATITNVYYSPQVRHNLISMSKLHDRGCTFNMCQNGNRIEVQSPKGIIVMSAIKGAHIDPYWTIAIQFNESAFTEARKSQASASVKETNMLRHEGIWHQRLQVSNDVIREMIKNEDVEGLDLNDKPDTVCRPCTVAKMRKHPFPSVPKDKRAQRPGQRVHLDEFFVHHVSFEGYIGGLLIKDEASQFIWMWGIKRKSDAHDIIVNFISWNNRQANDRRIMEMIMDNGGEFTAARTVEHIKSHGIMIQYTAPRASQQRGHIERAIGIIKTGTVHNLATGGFPNTFWHVAMQAYIHVKNRTRSRVIGTTPWYRWYNMRPSVGHIRVYGARSYVLDDDRRLRVTPQRVWIGYLVGYGDRSSNYQIYRPHTNTVYERTHVAFDETITYAMERVTPIRLNTDAFDVVSAVPPIAHMWGDEHRELSKHFQLSSTTTKSKAPVTSSVAGAGSNTPTDVRPIMSEQQSFWEVERILSHRKKKGKITEFKVKWVGYEEPTWEPRQNLCFKDNNGNIIINEQLAKYESQHKGNAVQTNANQAPTEMESSVVEHECNATSTMPQTYQQAINHELKDDFILGMQEEKQALIENGTLVPVKDVPTDAIILGSRWVFKKHSPEEIKMKKRKVRSRIVAQDLKARAQDIWGHARHDVFSPVVALEFVRLIVMVAWISDWTVSSGDVPKAFVQALRDQVKKVYITGPKGDPNFHGYYKVLRALYGFRDSPRFWYRCLKSWLNKQYYEELPGAPCVFVKKEMDCIVCAIMVYVDDIIITGLKDHHDRIVKSLKEHFRTNIVSGIDKFVGMKFNISKERVKISVPDKVQDVIGNVKFKAKIPINPEHEREDYTMSEDRGTYNLQELQQCIGQLLWLFRTYRPDLGATIRILSINARTESMKLKAIVQQARKYLYYTSNAVMKWSRPPTINYQVITWVDGAIGKRGTNYRSTIGYVVTLMNNPVLWKATVAQSSKNSEVATSSQEGELLAMFEASLDTVKITQVLGQIVGEAKVTSCMLCDNQVLVKGVNEQAAQRRYPHHTMKFEHIKDCVKKGVYQVIYTSAKYQVADGLTKALEATKFRQFKDWIKVIANDQEFKYGITVPKKVSDQETNNCAMPGHVEQNSLARSHVVAN